MGWSESGFLWASGTERHQPELLLWKSEDDTHMRHARCFHLVFFYVVRQHTLFSAKLRCWSSGRGRGRPFPSLSQLCVCKVSIIFRYSSISVWAEFRSKKKKKNLTSLTTWQVTLHLYKTSSLSWMFTSIFSRSLPRVWTVPLFYKRDCRNAIPL